LLDSLLQEMSYLEDRTGLESVTEELENLDTTDSDDKVTEVEKDTSDNSVNDDDGSDTEKKVATDPALLKSQFVLFSKFGDKTADGKTIKLSQSDKWFKQAGVIQAKGVSTTDTGIAFRKVSKKSPKLSFVEWNKYLDEIATAKKLDVKQMKTRLVDCGEPGFTGGTKVAKSAAVDRLTDTSKYGGAHRERFDSSGKGRGKEGREDAKSDGYVTGYKNKKGADAKMR